MAAIRLEPELESPEVNGRYRGHGPLLQACRADRSVDNGAALSADLMPHSGKRCAVSHAAGWLASSCWASTMEPSQPNLQNRINVDTVLPLIVQPPMQDRKACPI